MDDEHDDIIAAARGMVALARRTLAQTPTRSVTSDRAPPQGVQHRVTTAPPPSAPTSRPHAVTQRWVADCLVEVIGRVLTIERHAAGIRHAESERRIAALERRIEALTGGERRVAPPALRVVAS